MNPNPLSISISSLAELSSARLLFTGMNKYLVPSASFDSSDEEEEEEDEEEEEEEESSSRLRILKEYVYFTIIQ